MDYVAILEILILSNLRSGPVHGYELKNRVQRPTVTKLSNNSLYPILRRFERDGAVTSTREEQDGRPARNIYAITEVGRRLLSELISALPAGLAGNEEEFLVRLGFFHELAAAERAAILEARAAALDARLAQVRALASEAGGSKGLEWRDLAMDHLVSTLESEQRWISELAERTGAASVGAASAGHGKPTHDQNESRP
jgi:DNA-binding PadR family transcriptional regulator